MKEFKKTKVKGLQALADLVGTYITNIDTKAMLPSVKAMDKAYYERIVDASDELDQYNRRIVTEILNTESSVTKIKEALRSRKSTLASITTKYKEKHAQISQGVGYTFSKQEKAYVEETLNTELPVPWWIQYFSWILLLLAVIDFSYVYITCQTLLTESFITNGLIALSVTTCLLLIPTLLAHSVKQEECKSELDKSKGKLLVGAYLLIFIGYAALRISTYELFCGEDTEASTFAQLALTAILTVAPIANAVIVYAVNKATEGSENAQARPRKKSKIEKDLISTSLAAYPTPEEYTEAKENEYRGIEDAVAADISKWIQQMFHEWHIQLLKAIPNTAELANDIVRDIDRGAIENIVKEHLEAA